MDDNKEARKLDLELFLAGHDEKELSLLKNLIDKILLQKLKETEISVPISVFTKELSAGEALIKFLKENKKLKLSEIAKLINKKENAVWLNYNRAKEKSKSSFEEYFPEKINIPLRVFKIENLSYLESIVLYLREELRLSNNEIAAILKKSPQVLSIAYNRGKRKFLKNG